MKFTIESNGKKVTIETESDDLDIYEVFDKLDNLLVGAGYHPNSVKDGHLAKVEEIEDEEFGSDIKEVYKPNESILLDNIGDEDENKRD